MASSIEHLECLVDLQYKFVNAFCNEAVAICCKKFNELHLQEKIFMHLSRYEKT